MKYFAPRCAWQIAVGLVVGLAATMLNAQNPVKKVIPNFEGTKPDTRVTRLFEEAKDDPAICNGSSHEILSELLKRWEIPIETQILVYSKTSAQNPHISPETPRAIYYSDDVYLGWVQDGEIEVASFDPKLGMVFHLIELTTHKKGALPVLNRDQTCLNCHAGSSNHDMPGLMARSVHPAASGMPIFEAGSFHVRHSTPIEERWGGWYVTGHVEEREHLGNAVAELSADGSSIELRPLAKGNLDALDGLFVTAPYLNGGHSDVVSLMVLEHQVGVHNILVEANLTTRETLRRHVEMQKSFGEKGDAPLSDSNARILDRLATRVLHEMLYVDEIELPGGIEGGSAFQEAFEKGAIRSKSGKSLRDFRLYGRLMKYRCSHLIYSEAFQQLPPEMRSRILDQLHGILTEPDKWPEFAHLKGSERKTILEIVSETVPNLPASWK